MADDEKQPIIIKRVKKVEGGAHGGAWKVAYADFVTAMMAFFLLLWLLNVTTSEQKELISGYFEPTAPKISQALSGAGGVMGGRTMSQQGAQVSDKQPVIGQPGPPSMGGDANKTKAGNFSGDEQQGEGAGSKATVGEKDLEAIERAKLKEALDKKDEEEFKKVQQSIKQALQSSEELKALSKHLLMDMTPEGLRIQIVDQDGRAMFAIGSADMYDYTKKLHGLIITAVKDLPNKISIRGHTDSRSFGPGAKYTNWELSSDRANSSRRAMLDLELPLERIENVMGRADRDHLVPDDPYHASNRRISIILLKESLVPGVKKDGEDATEDNTEAEEPAEEPEQEAAPVEQAPIETAPEQERPFFEPPPIEFPNDREEGIIYFP